MKSGLRTSIILFALFVSSAAISMVSPLRACASPWPSLQPQGREVIRQRMVRLNPNDLLSQPRVNTVTLQLFDNLRLTALRKLEQREAGGFMLWTGQIQGAAGGKLVLVVRNGLIFASAYLGSSIIQIRPVNPDSADASQQYTIREIACPWRSPAVQTGQTAALRNRICPDCALGNGTLTADARKMVELVNLERKADGLPALQYDNQLTNAARRHALDMANHDCCSHQLTDGEQFYQNVFASGYPVSEVGENLAVGVATPEEAFECLLSSPDHRSNIMNSDFTQIGVSDQVNPSSGYRFFWAQEFGAASARSSRTIGLGVGSPRI